MATSTELAIDMKKTDAEALEQAVRVIRRRKVDPEGMSRAAFCRVLMVEADKLYSEIRALRGEGA